MKIAYITAGYTNSGGIERSLATKTNYLVNNGFEISIISSEPLDKNSFFSFNSAINFISIEANNKKEYVEKLTVIINEIKPAISISTGLGYSKYLYRINTPEKKIMEFHFSKYLNQYKLADYDKHWLGRFYSYFFSFKKTHIAKQYDKYVVLTEEDKEIWRGLDNVEVIPNPLPIIPSEYSDNSKKQIISVGRFTEQKGFDYLIDIWSKIASRYPDWKLIIYGTGPEKNKIEHLISEHKLSNSIELKEPSRTIFEEFINSSIYAMSSRFEGHPMVLLEAMSCGLPAVSFACKCGPKDVISDNEDGFLVAMGDKDRFVDKLIELIEDEDMRVTMGKAARQNMLRYREEVVMLKWLDLFKELTS